MMTNKQFIVADQVFDLHSKVVKLKDDINSSFLELGRLLWVIKDGRLFELLDYETFESYLAQPELSFDRSSVYRLIRIHEELVLKRGVALCDLKKIAWSKLDRIIPYLKDDNLEEMLEKAEHLSRSDLQQELKPHNPKLTTCPKCGYEF